ncbi:MAG TPA: carboxypeptidase-like regulatory domain-containing protein [candidate division Zixibacteria bacterium]|nr:carboxypeptidase-like regulatory domain-containing protein [candidate division Zixibacteria bacterium]
MRVILAFIVIALVFSVNAAVVNNSSVSVSSEDSLSVFFYSLDSLGNPAVADSVYLLVVGPSGTITAADSLAISDSRITATSIGANQCYSFAEQVSNLDGSGSTGCYCLTLLAHSGTLSLLTPNRTSFQLISTELSDQLAAVDDSVLVKGGIIDSNRTERGADSASIGRWVWDVPQSLHNLSGSFGGYLDTDISGISSGGGAYSCSVRLIDSATGLAVPGAGITVRSLNQSSVLASGRSDIEGIARFNLDAASYLITATAPGFTFRAYDTVAVDGPGEDTLFAFQFIPDAPELPAFCRVWGFLFTADGSPEVGATVAARIPTGMTSYGWAIISPVAVTAGTDSTGYFALDLLPSDSLGFEGADYEFTITRNDGAIFRRRLNVPDSTTWRFRW